MSNDASIPIERVPEAEHDRAPVRQDFWRIAAPDALNPPAAADVPSALERLGASPFPKSRFPFLGFLATVYDHVATHGGRTATKRP